MLERQIWNQFDYKVVGYRAKISSSQFISLLQHITSLALWLYTRPLSSFSCKSTNVVCSTRSPAGRFIISQHSICCNFRTSFFIACSHSSVLLLANPSSTDGLSSVGALDTPLMLKFSAGLRAQKAVLFGTSCIYKASYCSLFFTLSALRVDPSSSLKWIQPFANGSIFIFWASLLDTAGSFFTTLSCIVVPYASSKVFCERWNNCASKNVYLSNITRHVASK